MEQIPPQLVRKTEAINIDMLHTFRLKTVETRDGVKEVQAVKAFQETPIGRFSCSVRRSCSPSLSSETVTGGDVAECGPEGVQKTEDQIHTGSSPDALMEKTFSSSSLKRKRGVTEPSSATSDRDLELKTSAPPLVHERAKQQPKLPDDWGATKRRTTRQTTIPQLNTRRAWKSRESRTGEPNLLILDADVWEVALILCKLRSGSAEPSRCESRVHAPRATSDSDQQ